MRRFFAFCCVFALVLSLSGCGQKKRFQKTYIDYFDTAITIIGYEKSETDFSSVCQEIETLLNKYHKYFDIYNSYENVVNVYNINQAAGKSPLMVDKELLDFINYSKEIHDLTNAQTNIALGSVLKIWHEHREKATEYPKNATLPDISILNQAALHCDINDIVIDESASTVYLRDPDMLLDVGAVAKGYAMQKIYEYLEEKNITGYALNFGGMVRMLGKRGDGKEWTVAIENPISHNSYVPVISLKGLAISTSGSYQRFFEVDGVRYHHIIDPDTLMPENRFLAVSVLTENCTLADVLSTALFNMTLEEGQNLISDTNGAIGAMWVLPNGDREFFGDFKKYLVE